MKSISILILVGIILPGKVISTTVGAAGECTTCCMDKEIAAMVQKLVNKVETLENQLNVEQQTLKNFAVLLTSLVPGKCPLGFKEFKDSCYYFGKEPATWYAAKTLCNVMGATLVGMETMEEDYFIRQALTSLPGTFLGYYTSGNDLQDDNKWIWDSTGIPVGSHQPWLPLEGNKLGDSSNCLVYWRRNKFSGWDDLSCNEKNMSYICEKPK